MTRTRLITALLPFALLVAACAAETETPDPDRASEQAEAAEETDAQEDDLAAKPTFATTGPLVAKACGGCHAKFKTLAGIKAAKTKMVRMISSGAMPIGNPGFKSTPDGKKILQWLKTGTDLK